MSKLVLVALTAVAQVGILAGMIFVDSLPLRFGETVRLKVAPVDPRDFFRGDYVILSYDFSQLEPNTIRGLSDSEYQWNDGRDVYVSLKPAPDGQYWIMQKASAEQPKSGTWIRGTLRGWNRVDAGIGAYFVQEGEGLKIEQAIRDRRPVFADVAVWKGTARLKKVVVE
ncbi:GDYXXLXY domain-containing protein [Anatilimnocola sp. NA78]|uniref:GDYXXLXY domain-containing protein n=1 Tax=Anatilimnocola sp. NA78 TaxID=3415683 RepID=UPI003CE5A72D